MKRYVVTALVAGLLLAPDTKQDDAKKDKEALQGTWRAVTLEVAGMSLPAKEGVLLVIEKDTAVMKIGDTVHWRGTFKLDPAQKPKAIDFTLTEGDGKDKVELGIYEVSDDSLKWATSVPGGKTRPNEFSTDKTSHRLFTFKKEKS
jgi:uncharacterized protein (TIGR03067 family)